jgi:hypothetical protein
LFAYQGQITGHTTITAAEIFYKAEKPQNPFGNMMAFTSPEDLMKNLPKAIGNMSKAMTGGGFYNRRLSIGTSTSHINS